MTSMLLSQDRDKSQSGRISFEQLEDIFRIYQVRSKASYERQPCHLFRLSWMRRLLLRLQMKMERLPRRTSSRYLRTANYWILEMLWEGRGWSKALQRNHQEVTIIAMLPTDWKEGRYSKFHSLYGSLNKFSSPASCAAVGLRRMSSALSWSHGLTGWRQLSGSLTWMVMAS